MTQIGSIVLVLLSTYEEIEVITARRESQRSHSVPSDHMGFACFYGDTHCTIKRKANSGHVLLMVLDWLRTTPVGIEDRLLVDGSSEAESNRGCIEERPRSWAHGGGEELTYTFQHQYGNADLRLSGLWGGDLARAMAVKVAADKLGLTLYLSYMEWSVAETTNQNDHGRLVDMSAEKTEATHKVLKPLFNLDGEKVADSIEIDGILMGPIETSCKSRRHPLAQIRSGAKEVKWYRDTVSTVQRCTRPR